MYVSLRISHRLFNKVRTTLNMFGVRKLIKDCKSLNCMAILHLLEVLVKGCRVAGDVHSAVKCLQKIDCVIVQTSTRRINLHHIAFSECYKTRALRDYSNVRTSFSCRQTCCHLPSSVMVNCSWLWSIIIRLEAWNCVLKQMMGALHFCGSRQRD